MFGSSRDKAFARELVSHLMKDLPPASMNLAKGGMSVNRITRHLEKTYQAAVRYQTEHKLGFIRRALLANAFRWGLTNDGYPEAFVNVATEGLVVELSKAKRKS